jgi:TetR/AcrR family transcriptional regulator, lmrAB and yxaGH operons repressor
MPRRSDSRSKMIHAAAELFRQRGYHATALSDVIQASGAPRGSTYFHFPGGKQELAREVIALAGDEIEQMAAAAAASCDGPGSFVRALGDMVAARLEGSGYRSGCAIATMVLELAPENEDISTDFEKVFARWRKALAGPFVTWRITPARAADLADLVMSVFEGALVVSRAARRIDSFTTAIEALAELVEREPRRTADSVRTVRPYATEPTSVSAPGYGPSHPGTPNVDGAVSV